MMNAVHPFPVRALPPSSQSMRRTLTDHAVTGLDTGHSVLK